jgi:chromosome segregation ATPase
MEDIKKELLKCKEKISKCDELYYQYKELSQKFKDLSSKCETLEDEHNALKSRFFATRQTIKEMKTQMLENQSPIKSSPKRNKKITIIESPSRIEYIERIGNKPTPIMKNKGKEWQDFISEHSGKGYSMKELSKMYKEQK